VQKEALQLARDDKRHGRAHRQVVKGARGGEIGHDFKKKNTKEKFFKKFKQKALSLKPLSTTTQ
jgi:hypothetical protein